MASNRGNDAVCGILRGARACANRDRLYGGLTSDFSRGMYVGQIIMAAVHLDADPIATQAADNEVNFLCGRYVRGQA